MDIGLGTFDQWIIVHVQGRLDSFNHEHLAIRLATLVRMSARHVAVDLTGVSFMNLMAAKTIARSFKQFQEHNGTFVVLTQDEQIRMMLTLLAPPDSLRLLSSREELR